MRGENHGGRGAFDRQLFDRKRIADVIESGAGVYDVTFSAAVTLVLGATADTRFTIDAASPNSIAQPSAAVARLSGLSTGATVWAVAVGPQPAWLLTLLCSAQSGDVS